MSSFTTVRATAVAALLLMGISMAMDDKRRRVDPISDDSIIDLARRIRHQSLAKDDQRRIIDVIPNEITVEIAKRIRDPSDLARLGTTCRTAHSTLSPLITVARLFSHQTPIQEVPGLIRSFADQIGTSSELRAFVDEFKPQQAVDLLNRFLVSTERTVENIFGKSVVVSSTVDPPLSKNEVAGSVRLLIQTVNRPEITRAASVLFLFPKTTGSLPLDIDGIPLPTLDQAPQVLRDAIIAISQNRQRGYQDNGDVAYDLLESNELIEEMHSDMIGVLIMLLGVGIRFNMNQFLRRFDITPDSFDDIIPLLVPPHPREVNLILKFSLLGRGKIPQAISLLKTSHVREAMRENPSEFTRLCAELEKHPAEFVKAFVQAPFIEEIRGKKNPSIHERELLSASNALESKLSNTPNN